MTNTVKALRNIPAEDKQGTKKRNALPAIRRERVLKQNGPSVLVFDMMRFGIFRSCARLYGDAKGVLAHDRRGDGMRNGICRALLGKEGCKQALATEEKLINAHAFGKKGLSVRFARA
jgi:hypothetical protein